MLKMDEKESDVRKTTKKPFFKALDLSVHKEIALKDRFHVLLLRRGLSQNKLADEVGITAQTLSNIINHKWQPTSAIKIRLAKALEVDSLVLFGATEYWKEWREGKMGYPKEDKDDNNS